MSTVRRIGSGTEIIAYSSNGSNHASWQRTQVLGLDRDGIVPIRICEPDKGRRLIRLTELERLFSNGNTQINCTQYKGLDYNIQRLWDYDKLWKHGKKGASLRLRLDPTWVILDQKENIAMLMKKYPEDKEIPFGYKRTKIEPLDGYRIDEGRIKIHSLREAIEHFNFLISFIRPANPVIVEPSESINEVRIATPETEPEIDSNGFADDRRAALNNILNRAG